MNNKPLYVGSIAVVLLIVFSIVWYATSGYGEVSSNAYELATATYGACMSQNPQRLQRAVEMMQDPQFQAGLSGREVRWFERMFSQAQREQWSSAAAAARQMMEDQVR